MKLAFAHWIGYVIGCALVVGVAAWFGVKHGARNALRRK